MCPTLIFSKSATFASGALVTNSYEPHRNLKTSVLNKYNTTTISQYDYTHDNIGRRKTMTTSGDAFSISLPVPPDQKLVNTGTYTSVGYTANDLNQYTSVETNGAAASPAYDNDGGLTDDGTFTYTWNGENRLITITPKTPTVGEKKLAFLYDYMGRRARKITTAWDGSTWQADETCFFAYDGWNLIEELDGTGAVTASYVYGLDLSQSLQDAGGIGGILARVDHGTDKVHLYFYDANGNVGQLIDTADGSVVAAYEYAPFGGLTSVMGSYAEVNPFRFSSKYADDTTGLYYYGYRYYSPELGRWLSRDPVGEDGGLNLYGFVGNSPLVYFDPYGMSVWGDLGSFAKGAGESAGNMIYEPLATAYDLEQIIIYTIIADPGKFSPTSSIGKAGMAGSGTGKILGSMAAGVVMVPVEYVEAVISGDPKRIGAATFNLEAFLYGGLKGKLNASVKTFVTTQAKSFIKGCKKSCSFLIRREGYISKRKVRVNLGGEGEIPGVINQQGSWAANPSWKSSRGGKTVQQLQDEGHQFVISDNSQLPFKNGSVDEVITNSVPIDTPDTWLGPSIKSIEIRRILKDNGQWINNGVAQ
ncbi:MAG: RHS repeat-associated core domain-containing protein [Candidatus Electrothrix aestuarii]|uniref:RHS repeat-associated core domain-containing protein n=1 Tax=Candidatus Electrothrix aestuarii TaxID=3062594 RepID=A0AAU8LPL6_9BACT